MSEVDQSTDFKIAARKICGFVPWWLLREKLFQENHCPAAEIDSTGRFFDRRACQIIKMIRKKEDPKQLASNALGELTKRFGDNQAEICQVVRWALKNAINTPQSQEK
ncbi:MAG: hypothetical protein ABIH35_01735 [Patescibacteria group bacterium]